MERQPHSSVLAGVVNLHMGEARGTKSSLTHQPGSGQRDDLHRFGEGESPTGSVILEAFREEVSSDWHFEWVIRSGEAVGAVRPREGIRVRKASQAPSLPIF